MKNKTTGVIITATKKKKRMLKAITGNKKLLFAAALTGLLSSSCTPTKEKDADIQKTGKEVSLAAFLGEKNYTSIKLNTYETGHLYIEATMNGVKGRFILDTGAGSTVIEEKRKDKFNMTATASTDQATGVGGNDMALQSSKNNSFVMGEYKIEAFEVTMMNLDHVNGAFKQMGMQEADGVIGADILAQGQAIIDYAQLVLYLKK